MDAPWVVCAGSALPGARVAPRARLRAILAPLTAGPTGTASMARLEAFLAPWGRAFINLRISSVTLAFVNVRRRRADDDGECATYDPPSMARLGNPGASRTL